ncbi:MAG: tetratricopeptide repeat protein, partial [Patescibacteria group bacterium]
IGVAYMGKGRYAEAAEAFRATAAMDPKAIAAYINLGIAEEKLNHPDAAKEAYGKALEIDPASRIAGERLTALEADR